MSGCACGKFSLVYVLLQHELLLVTLSRVTGRWQTGSPVVQAWALTDQRGQGALSLRPQIAVLPGTVLLQGVSQKQPVPTLLPSGGLAEAVGVSWQIGCQGGKGTGHSHATHIPVGVNSALACRCQLQQSPSGTGEAPHAFGLLVWLGVDMTSWTLQPGRDLLAQTFAGCLAPFCLHPFCDRELIISHS